MSKPQGGYRAGTSWVRELAGSGAQWPSSGRGRQTEPEPTGRVMGPSWICYRRQRQREWEQLPENLTMRVKIHNQPLTAIVDIPQLVSLFDKYYNQVCAEPGLDVRETTMSKRDKFKNKLSRTQWVQGDRSLLTYLSAPKSQPVGHTVCPVMCGSQVLSDLNVTLCPRGGFVVLGLVMKKSKAQRQIRIICPRSHSWSLVGLGSLCLTLV